MLYDANIGAAAEGLLQLAISTNDVELVEVVLNQKNIDVNKPDVGDAGVAPSNIYFFKSCSRWSPLICAILTSVEKEIVRACKEGSRKCSTWSLQC